VVFPAVSPSSDLSESLARIGAVALWSSRESPSASRSSSRQVDLINTSVLASSSAPSRRSPTDRSQVKLGNRRSGLRPEEVVDVVRRARGSRCGNRLVRAPSRSQYCERDGLPSSAPNSRRGGSRPVTACARTRTADRALRARGTRNAVRIADALGRAARPLLGLPITSLDPHATRPPSPFRGVLVTEGGARFSLRGGPSSRRYMTIAVNYRGSCRTSSSKAPGRNRSTRTNRVLPSVPRTRQPRARALTWQARLGHQSLRCVGTDPATAPRALLLHTFLAACMDHID